MKFARVGAGVLILLAAVLVIVLVVSPVPARKALPKPHPHPPKPHPTSLTYTLLASPLGSIAGYGRPGGTRVTTVPTSYLDSPLITPVIAQRAGFDDIRLPGRPNGSTTWVRAADVLTTATPYQIIINLKTTHLELLRAGKVILNAPVGVGTSQYPTPTGNYFVALYAYPANSGYGPFVMVISAHSNKITDWEGSGDAIVAIHGPLGADALIGTTGAQVSHGCIRMHVADQQKLGSVPVGTPVSIIQ